MDEVVSIRDLAFGRGCDARISGRPLTANPYHSSREKRAREAWQKGWQDVDMWWGRRAKWRVRQLPPVRVVSAVS